MKSNTMRERQHAQATNQTLEEQLDAFAKRYREVYQDRPINWEAYKNSPGLLNTEHKFYHSRCNNFWKNIQQMIADAPLGCALTSPLVYVREYRAFVEAQANKEKNKRKKLAKPAK